MVIVPTKVYCNKPPYEHKERRYVVDDAFE